ncbi:hypothetical protein ACOYR1_17455 [Thalassotalea piscium]
MKAQIIVVSFLISIYSSVVLAESIVIDNKIPFAEGANIRDAIKDECELEEKFSRFIKAYAKDRGFTVLENSDDKAKSVEKYLSVEIDRVHGNGGGAWSGGKMVHATGKLTEAGKLIGTFNVQRTSGGGAFGAFKGTCSILGRDVKAMAKDISVWLTKPKMQSNLGEL